MCGQQQLRHFASFIGLIEYVCRNTKRRRKWLADNRHCTSRVINAKRRKQWKRRKPEQRHLPCKLDSGQPWSVLWKLHSVAGHAANVACCSSHVARRTVPVPGLVCWPVVPGLWFLFSGWSCVKNGNCVSAYTTASIALFRNWNCVARTKATCDGCTNESEGGGTLGGGGWPLIMQKTATTLKLPIAAHVIKDEKRNATQHNGSVATVFSA